MNCKNCRSVGGSALKPPLASGGGAPPQTPSYCSHTLLQLRNLNVFVGGHTKIFCS